MNNISIQYLNGIKIKNMKRNINKKLKILKSKISFNLFSELVNKFSYCKECENINMYIDLDNMLQNIKIDSNKKVKLLLKKQNKEKLILLKKLKKDELIKKNYEKRQILLKLIREKKNENLKNIKKNKKLSLKLEWDYENPCEK